mmetsp:Transcript_80836/g.121497  ORF Transcript_80836/g.121497 Transcript_80836/m.121497 type:complete len:522 (-) Transcript_80836:442-2007(-)
MSLVYMFSKCKDNRMIANWADQLLEYNFTIVHCPGTLNILPDYLSRLYVPSPIASKETHIAAVSAHTPQPYNELKNFIKERFNKVEPEDKEFLMNHFHIMNHQGPDQLFRQLFYNGFYWSSMRKDCDTVVANCQQCLSYNVRRMGYHPLTTITASLPFDHVAIDLFGPFPATIDGYTFVLLLIDIFTRFTLLEPLHQKSAECTAAALYRMFCNFGFPKIIQSDNGPEFVNSVIKAMFNLTGVSQRLIAPYHPEANGAAERDVSLSKTLLFKLASGDFTQWDKFLPSVQLGINMRISSRHKSSPFSLMFGRRSNDFKDYSGTSSVPRDENIIMQRSNELVNIIYPEVNRIVDDYNKKTKKSHTKSRLIIDRMPNESLIMLKDPIKKPKSAPKYNGPYYIHSQCRNGSYRLRDMTGEVLPTKFPAKHIKLIKNPIIRGDNVAEVEDIISHRGFGDNREYLVSWRDDPIDSWVKMSDFGSRDILEKYHEGNMIKSVSEAAPGSSSTVGSRRSSRKRKNKVVFDL